MKANESTMKYFTATRKVTSFTPSRGWDDQASLKVGKATLIEISKEQALEVSNRQSMANTGSPAGQYLSTGSYEQYMRDGDLFLYLVVYDENNQRQADEVMAHYKYQTGEA